MSGDGRFTPLREENKGGAVHAISFAGRGRSVIKDMPQMRSALTVHYFPSFHAIAVVFDQSDCIRANGSKEAGPSGMGIEFGIGTEYRLQGGCRVIDAFLIKMVILPCTSSFCSLLPEYIILIRSELLFPLGIGMDYGVGGFGSSDGRVRVFCGPGLSRRTEGIQGQGC